MVRRVKNQQGITILEVVISLMIMSTAILGLYSTYIKAAELNLNGLNAVRSTLEMDSIQQKRIIAGNTKGASVWTNADPEYTANCFLEPCSQHSLLLFSISNAKTEMQEAAILYSPMLIAGQSISASAIFSWPYADPNNPSEPYYDGSAACAAYGELENGKHLGHLGNSSTQVYNNDWRSNSCVIFR